MSRKDIHRDVTRYELYCTLLDCQYDHRLDPGREIIVIMFIRNGCRGVDVVRDVNVVVGGAQDNVAL